MKFELKTRTAGLSRRQGQPVGVEDTDNCFESKTRTVQLSRDTDNRFESKPRTVGLSRRHGHLVLVEDRQLIQVKDKNNWFESKTRTVHFSGIHGQSLAVSTEF